MSPPLRTEYRRPVPLSVRQSADDIRYVAEDSYATAVIADEACLDTMSNAFRGRDILRIARTEQRSDVIDLDSAMATQDDELGAVATHAEDMAFWLYSSGSTGRPKGVVHRH